MVNSVNSIVSFISKLLSFFGCCSVQHNKTNGSMSSSSSSSSSHNKLISNDNNIIYKNDDKSSELVVNGYVRDGTSSINTNNFFCGSIPSSITDICSKYCYFGNSMLLQVDDYLNLESNPSIKIDSDINGNDNKYIEYFSSDYRVKKDIIFRNIICVEINEQHNEYETDYYLQLISLPKNIDHITIDYDLSSIDLDLKWKNIVTMKIGDIVGAPSVIKTKSFFNELKEINNDINKGIKFQCNINVLLKNGTNNL